MFLILVDNIFENKYRGTNKNALMKIISEKIIDIFKLRYF